MGLIVGSIKVSLRGTRGVARLALKAVRHELFVSLPHEAGGLLIVGLTAHAMVGSPALPGVALAGVAADPVSHTTPVATEAPGGPTAPVGGYTTPISLPSVQPVPSPWPIPCSAAAPCATPYPVQTPYPQPTPWPRPGPTPWPTPTPTAQPTPVPTPMPAPPCPAPATLTCEVTVDLFADLNADRAQANLTGFNWSQSLSDFADAKPTACSPGSSTVVNGRVADMIANDYFDFAIPTCNGALANVPLGVPYAQWGEAIKWYVPTYCVPFSPPSCDPKSPQAIADVLNYMYMGSNPRSHILDPNLTQVGIGTEVTTSASATFPSGAIVSAVEFLGG